MTEAEIEQLSSSSPSSSSSLDPYYQLINSCRSSDTKKNYTQFLQQFMAFLHLSPLDYDKLLQTDPLIITKNICQWIVKMRENGCASGSITVRLAAINKFYTMNDIVLNWKKINSFVPERERVAEDRPYTHSEIKKLLENTSLRNRAIILLMCSSGARLGTIPDIRIKDLEPIDNHNIYKITYYPKSKKYRYFSFCSPECRKEIDSYLEWRKRWGERLTDESPLFRREYNPNVGWTVKAITNETIKVFMKKLLQETGLRTQALEGKYKRQNIMLTHGLRKFFETNAFRAGMSEPYCDRLMGHKGGSRMLSEAYNKIEEEELLHGDSKHVGYIGIIDQLTINEEHRLRIKVDTLEAEKTALSQLAAEIDRIKEQMNIE